MFREGNRIFFTDEDCEFLRVSNHTLSEQEEIQEEFNNARRKRRIIYLSIIVMLILCSLVFSTLKYLFFLAFGIIILLFILDEHNDRKNRDVVGKQFYIEIIIEEKLDIETYLEQFATVGTELFTFYPVYGRDSSTGYRSKFYLTKDQYDNVEKDDFAKISVKGEII